MPAARDAEDAETNGLSTLQIKVGGMSCSFCAESIRKAVGRTQGVEEVHVSLAHEEALVRYDPGRLEASRIHDTLRGLGYTVRDPRKVQSFEEQEAIMRQERRNLFVAASFATVLVLAMAAMWLDLWQMRPWHIYTAFVVATYVFFWTGRHILRMAWGAARRGIANQHVLLTAGALAGYIGGLLGSPIPFTGWNGFYGFPAVDFYGVVVFLTTYHLLSGFVSLKVRTRASRSVRKLLGMQPPTARVVRDGHEEEVAIEEVRVGDRVRIRPGEKVPVDGDVVEGRSAVDQALVTGEPIPAQKETGDEVIGGSVNQTGTLLVRVTRVGEESFLRRVARHVEEAKALKPGIIELVDRVLKYYVPVVLTISLGAYLFWVGVPLLLGAGPLYARAIYAAVTVLVMGYPCALGMATPLALIRGGGMAAERGILMRSGEAFQILKDIRVIVLDKTGTITQGRPQVVKVYPLGGYAREEILHYAGSAEVLSEHPLARTIVACAEEEEVGLSAAEDFDAITGGGVQATVDGRAVLIGAPRLLGERGVPLAGAEAVLAGEEEKGRTAVLVAAAGELAGIISIADALKPDAAEAIASIRALGIRTIMLTGDAGRTARAVAAEVGIEEVRARVLPQEKAERVRELQAQGVRAAFVGDGINDAPALMQADVGIAIGAGTDIAIESSDVILIGERLGAVVDAYHIGRKSYRKTVQNLVFAFSFNAVGVPLAATGLVHPVWAMIAMAASVSAVLLNSFGGRLLPKRRPREGVADAAAAGTEVSPAQAGTDVRAIDRTPPGAPTEVVLEVPDIHCAGCEQNIQMLLGGREGIDAVDADAKTHQVRVVYGPERIGLHEIEEAVTSLGYRVHRAHAVEGEDI
ncbi:MAG TPA: heavy metal translocating P-type ATPase [Longimicrobiales bacterium]|nr:heavy metal translocating P-type ATPase [Longimicrobiales bacterium]